MKSSEGLNKKSKTYNIYYFDVVLTYSVGNYTIEVEKGLSYSVYDSYYKFLKEKVYANMPFLYDGYGKVVMETENTINSTYGEYVGMTYGLYHEYVNSDVKVDSYVDDYGKYSFIHEQAHCFDDFYGVMTGTKLNEQQDIITLYNKYKAYSSNSRPLRDYAYKSIDEFVAESIEFYYYYIYELRPILKDENPITFDIINVFEKYFTIARNGYIS